jgi:hypothetical protein
MPASPIGSVAPRDRLCAALEEEGAQADQKRRTKDVAEKEMGCKARKSFATQQSSLRVWDDFPQPQDRRPSCEDAVFHASVGPFRRVLRGHGRQSYPEAPPPGLRPRDRERRPPTTRSPMARARRRSARSSACASVNSSADRQLAGRHGAGSRAHSDPTGTSADGAALLDGGRFATKRKTIHQELQ